MSHWQSAFGAAPTEPVPVGAERWAHAVELGARGRAAGARAVVDELLRDRRTSATVRSLAYSTRASLTRQVGRHAAARGDDGAAVRAVVGAEGAWAVAARVDALVGLAADSLGIADFAASRLLLDRADAELADAELADSDGAATDWICRGRPRLRLAWVRTELALYAGDDDSATLADRARQLAVDAPSLRHRSKTDLIAAAATAARGAVDDAAAEADRLARLCHSDGLLPLEWAARTMLAGVRPGTTSDRTPDGLRAEMIGLGMAFAPLPGSRVTGRYA